MRLLQGCSKALCYCVEVLACGSGNGCSLAPGGGASDRVRDADTVRKGKV